MFRYKDRTKPLALHDLPTMELGAKAALYRSDWSHVAPKKRNEVVDPDLADVLQELSQRNTTVARKALEIHQKWLSE